MITLHEALQIIDSEQLTLAVETVPLEEAGGRMLAEPVYSRIELPVFDTARMDGYAIAAGETETELQVLDTLPAGTPPRVSPEAAACVRIMTGAQVPPGTDRVVPRELVVESEHKVTLKEIPADTNISRAGSYLAAGTLLKAGGHITAADIGAFAGAGVQSLRVYAPVRMSLLVTGDELAAAGDTLGPAQIYDAVGPMLSARAAKYGVEIVQAQTVPDDPQALEAAVRIAMDKSQILVISGGVSRGDYDYTADVLQACGIRSRFHRVAIKPGRPIFFGSRATEEGGGVRVFGLPGNPVSAFVDYLIFTERLIRATGGLPHEPAGARVRAAAALEPSDPSRGEFFPVRLIEGRAHPVDYINSGDLAGFSAADGVVFLPQGALPVEAGGEVYVRPL